MAGTVLENLSGRKLAYLVSTLLICQIICFLIGGLIAPAPSNVNSILATKCLDLPLRFKEFDTVWHIPRGSNGRKNINCNVVDLIDPKFSSDPSVTPNHLVFAFQAPLPKDGMILDYSRWMATLNAVLQLDIAYMKQNPMAIEPKITFNVKLGYRNKWDPDDKWTLLANSTETRDLHCTIDNERKIEGYHYDCDLLPLFELGSLHHDYYLVNLRLPTDPSGINEGIGHIDDIWMVVIHQNGGFTKVWVSLKTVFFPVLLVMLIWYWKRICLLCRPPILIEKMLLGLGISLSILNFPFEYLTLWINMPFMILLSDFKQGIFYASLLSFWLVFCGEHLMDEIERNRLRSYWRYLTSVVFGCFCLFIFDMCERGVQLKNPFFSIWTSTVGANLSLGFIILAGFSACMYFIFLCYLVYKVFKNIGFKKNTLPSMSSAKRMYCEGIIYRFKFLMMATVICAALTIIAFIVGQVSEGKWKWDDNISVEYTSAFFTGVYGMWNLYTIALLALYAPSHKYYPAQSGIAPNTMLAKVCSDQNKPNGQYQILSSAEAVKLFISTLPVKKISGIGPVQGQILNAIDIVTCADLWNKRDLVSSLFSANSVDFYMRVALGIGSTTVKSDYVRKSIGNEQTFREIHLKEDLHKKCEELCDDLIEDMKSRNLLGKVVVLKIKTTKFETHTRNHSLPYYTDDPEIIYNAARKLLDFEIAAVAPQPLKLRLMGIRMCNLVPADSVSSNEKQPVTLKTFLQSKTLMKVKSPEKKSHEIFSCPICLKEFETDFSIFSDHVNNCLEIENDININNCDIDSRMEAATSKEHDDSNNISLSSGSKSLTYSCPVCGSNPAVSSLEELNTHIDNCLNKAAIKDILSEDLQTSSKRKSSNPQKDSS